MGRITESSCAKNKKVKSKVKATAANTKNYASTLAMQKRLKKLGANINADGITDIKDIVKEKQDLSDRQLFLIKMLQMELQVMYTKLKELNERLEKK